MCSGLLYLLTTKTVNITQQHGSFLEHKITVFLLSQLPLASDVSLATIASMTEGFSGADLQALLADSQLAAVNEVLKNNPGQSAKPPYISDVHLRSVASKARPSVSESEKQRLHAIYNQFLDSKKSVNSKVCFGINCLYLIDRPFYLWFSLSETPLNYKSVNWGYVSFFKENPKSIYTTTVHCYYIHDSCIFPCVQSRDVKGKRATLA